MTNTGMIRKIDNLGRIVIPKEIRLTMNLKDEDDLEILVENDQIILKKYSLLNDKYKESDILVKAFNMLMDGNILISDRERIITPGPLYNKDIPSKISNLINNRANYISSENETFLFDNVNITNYFSAFPIIENSVVKGFIIYISSKYISNEEKKYIDVIKNIIENKQLV